MGIDSLDPPGVGDVAPSVLVLSRSTALRALPLILTALTTAVHVAAAAVVAIVAVVTTVGRTLGHEVLQLGLARFTLGFLVDLVDRFGTYEAELIS